MSLTAADVDRIAAILADAARAEVMPRFNRLQSSAVRAKTSAIDLVTDADEAAERHITAALRQAFPAALIVGEEATAADPSLLDALPGAPLAFVVDPIDGTRNFVAGLPLFGVMAAAIAHGEIVAGVILDPVSGNVAHALRGHGAWMRQSDGQTERLRVSSPAEPARMTAMVSVTYMEEPLRSTVAARTSRLASTACLRCAAHEYRLTAAGHNDLLVYNKLMPWDHAPGWLLHREAGGYSAHFDGTPYLPAHRSGGLLCAPDEASWRAARALLLD